MSAPVVSGCVLICSRQDTDINTSLCKLAFNGTLVWQTRDKVDFMKNELTKLKVFKHKLDEGVMERAVDDQEVILRDLFNGKANFDLFCRLRVNLSSGEKGSLEGTFGQSGRVKVTVLEVEGLEKETIARVGMGKKGEPVVATIKFKRIVLLYIKRCSNRGLLSKCFKIS